MARYSSGAMKAKNGPIRYRQTAPGYTRAADLRILAHLAASA